MMEQQLFIILSRRPRSFRSVWGSEGTD